MSTTTTTLLASVIDRLGGRCELAGYAIDANFADVERMLRSGESTPAQRERLDELDALLERFSGEHERAIAWLCGRVPSDMSATVPMTVAELVRDGRYTEAASLLP